VKVVEMARTHGEAEYPGEEDEGEEEKKYRGFWIETCNRTKSTFA
jgi:hypothetical protein